MTRLAVLLAGLALVAVPVQSRRPLLRDGPRATHQSKRSNDNVPSSTRSFKAMVSVGLPPMMIVQRACTGSSVVMRMARRLLTELGVSLYPLPTKEILRKDMPEKNPWFTQGGDLAEAMRRGVEEAQQASQTLLFGITQMSSTTDSVEQSNLNAALAALHTRSVIVHRNNTLDTAVCEVRDCFNSTRDAPRGYPVNERGEEDTSCFQRRHDSSVTTMAFLDTDDLLRNLELKEQYPKQTQESLIELGIGGHEIVFYEDLVSHEYSAGNLRKSTFAWLRLLSSLGIQAGWNEVMASLSQDVGTYHSPLNHSSTIFNVQEVAETLRNSSERIWMLRGEGRETF
eukprot:CAMPEP_0170607318 /NCGR_PEP_ID=MMETSP0224-20130122/20988_1 /TAXON_ID=285029 /ORGANISM="Togula jolla, Strain CCCM 725" /LENGTH=340 /DNA_ID=CAMNT_0010932471 /DNA_START=1 /DNA_END=1023 /DNA_ORIENTATION=-